MLVVLGVGENGVDSRRRGVSDRRDPMAIRSTVEQDQSTGLEVRSTDDRVVSLVLKETFVVERGLLKKKIDEERRMIRVPSELIRLPIDIDVQRTERISAGKETRTVRDDPREKVEQRRPRIQLTKERRRGNLIEGNHRLLAHFQFVARRRRGSLGEIRRVLNRRLKQAS